MSMSTCCTNIRIAVKSALFIALSASILLTLSTPALAQDSPREVRAKAQAALEKGAYADAIGYLQQMIEWYGSSKKDAAIMQMEMIYFYLGTSHFFIGQFNEARAAFTVYRSGTALKLRTPLSISPTATVLRNVTATPCGLIVRP